MGKIFGFHYSLPCGDHVGRLTPGIVGSTPALLSPSVSKSANLHRGSFVTAASTPVKPGDLYSNVGPEVLLVGK